MNLFYLKNENKTIKTPFNITLFLIVACFITISNTSYSVDIERVENLTDENIVLTEPVEYHITGTTNLMVNSTIDIQNVDAWIIFDNVRPSDALSVYGSSIKINGSTFSSGVNGRLAIFKHGSAFLPHGSDFKPLTVYSDQDFTGDSMQCVVHTYYKSLGALENAIKSIKLKRGYMATFANNSDGTGYSRVFIADEKDLNISMPELLSGKISFIRVFYHQWVTKKGWCGGSYEAGLTNSTWYYDWQAFSATTNDQEFVPMRAKLNWSPWSTIGSIQNVSQLLGLNEPDHPEQHKDDNGEKAVTVDQALAQWPEMLKSGLRVGAPATTDFNWVIEFVNRCDQLNYRVDYVAVHAYWGNDPSSYLSSLSWVHNATGRPIWITEWNYGANWTNEWWPDNTWEYTTANADYAKQKISAIVDFFDETPWIERYSIYNWVEDRRAVVLNGQLTKAGEYYANDTSVVAFNRDYEVIPDWNMQKPKLTSAFLSATNEFKMYWTNPNGELVSQYIIQKRVGDGSYEDIFSTTDYKVAAYADPVSGTNSGNCTYRLKVIGYDQSIIYSDEVSYFSTQFGETLQLADLGVENLNWETCVFSQNFSEIPAVILGPSSNYNTFPYTQRVKSVSENLLNFKFYPWLYLTNPTMSKADNASLLSIIPGVYNFSGLNAIAGNVTSLKGDWVQVEFPESFDNVPVIFFTQVSDNSFVPTAVSIRNVTADGFEVCIRKETTASGSIFSETISYLAVTPGFGIVDGKRIIVNSTAENAVGSILQSQSVDIPESFSEPLIFADLQTANDDYTSNLRYYYIDNNTIRLFKKREASSSASVDKDKMGYMLIDASDDQPLAVNEVKSFPNNILINNPVKDQLWLNLDRPTMVQIFDMMGNVVIVKNVLNSLDISNLSSGTYIVKINGVEPIKIVKL